MGKPRIITTWPEQASGVFSSLLESKDFEVLSMPLTKIIENTFLLKQPIETYDWIVFTSKNGVKHFWQNQTKHKRNKIAVIGGGTAKAFDRLPFNPDFVGTGQSGQQFAKELTSVVKPGQKLLLALGNKASGLLEKAFEKDFKVERIDVYATEKASVVDRGILTLVDNNAYDLIAVSSPSAVQHLSELTEKRQPSDIRMVSIGQTTTGAALESGFLPLATADPPGYDNLARCVFQLFFGFNQ
jgi:uroporphyrinogen-III synthase